MHKIIAGIDEVGRGALAGPIVAACVVIPNTIQIPSFIKDSKQLSPTKRQIAFDWIQAHCLFATGSSTQKYIDTYGIKKANFKAMKIALKKLQCLCTPTEVVIDGNDNFTFNIRSTYIIKGDTFIPCISAASIVAKVLRDAYMVQMHRKDKRFGYNTHKGYGTKTHYAALKKFGTSTLHRQTFIHL